MNWQSIYFPPRVGNIHGVRFKYAREFFIYYELNWMAFSLTLTE